MKIRNGFVSNSSSSSFLVVTKENSITDFLYKYLDVLLEYPIPTNLAFARFLNFITPVLIEELAQGELLFYKGNSDTEGVNVLTTETEVDEYLDDREIRESVFREIKKRVKDGSKVFLLDLPNYGDGGSNFQSAMQAVLSNKMTNEFIFEENT
jgi:hypothetical protein